MQQFWMICSLLLGIAACTSPGDSSADSEGSPTDKAQEVVDRAIAAHGGGLFDSATFSFTFRGRLYKRMRSGGSYQFERIFINPDDSTQEVRDILTNEGLTREINGAVAAIPDTMAFKYANSVNSVIYFAVLPYRLNDGAVFKKYLGEVDIKGKTYDKVQVTFAEEGGGKDFDDIFIYWFNQDTHQLDYLAYKYETDGGGIRFREALNPRRVGGLLFQDYVNYKMDKRLPLETADSLFEAGELEKLSEILLEEIAHTNG